MLARKSLLTHPVGFTFETPILVPSFSSKGFLFSKKGERLVSEATFFMELTSEILTETLLVSAYDIYRNHIDGVNKISNIARLTFIDSGGYEVSDHHDLSATLKHPIPIEAKEWNESKLESTLNKFPKNRAAAFINFDRQDLSFPKQIDAARKFFARYPNQLRDFIIKPERKKGRGQKGRTFINIEAIAQYISELSHFDIIGITEKELGDSILDRMLKVAKLRDLMDANHITKPIHIFGSLDPLSTCLYFLAGAEIFDGLTWLRYSYYQGNAIYHSNRGTLTYGIHEKDEFVFARSIRENIFYITRLQHQMHNFLLKRDFKQFEFQHKKIKEAFETFEAKRGGKH